MSLLLNDDNDDDEEVNAALNNVQNDII